MFRNLFTLFVKPAPNNTLITNPYWKAFSSKAVSSNIIIENPLDPATSDQAVKDAAKQGSSSFLLKAYWAKTLPPKRISQLNLIKLAEKNGQTNTAKMLQDLKDQEKYAPAAGPNTRSHLKK